MASGGGGGEEQGASKRARIELPHHVFLKVDASADEQAIDVKLLQVIINSGLYDGLQHGQTLKT